jgi:saccharopine dehydrogenase-like NADP-dependent oxidoreductase
MAQQCEVLVVGGGGLQAQAMFEAASRAHDLSSWVAVDRAWRPARQAGVERFGVRTAICDILVDPDGLRELVGSAKLVANFAGPFYRTGAAVLDACITTGTDYMDICDDADATLELLGRDDSARAAGICALLGMGSSPGVTNVLVRAAVDALGAADEVSINWTVDVSDVGAAAAQHFWHIFALVDGTGTRQPVASWDRLSRRRVTFPDPLGDCTVLEFSHPEPITIPRFLPVDSVRNFGGIWPDDALFVSWALARLGADGGSEISVDGATHLLPDVAEALYERYRREREPTPYRGGGLVVDVRRGEDGYRFASGDSTSMEESTGTPAAAGILMLLRGEDLDSGVLAPECLQPSQFFPTLGSVSRSTGSLALHRLHDGELGERIRIRDLITSVNHAR